MESFEKARVPRMLRIVWRRLRLSNTPARASASVFVRVIGIVVRRTNVVMVPLLRPAQVVFPTDQPHTIFAHIAIHERLAVKGFVGTFLECLKQKRM